MKLDQRWVGGLLALALAVASGCGDDAVSAAGDAGHDGGVDSSATGDGGSFVGSRSRDAAATSSEEDSDHETLGMKQCAEGDDTCGKCALGYAGVDCDECAEGFVSQKESCIEDACADLACGDHGSCVQAGTKAHCACDIGFGGALCDACDDGYTGDTCDTCDDGFTHPDEADGVDVEACVPDVCIGHACGLFGTCVDDGGAPACECNEGHEGAACDDCKPGYSPSFESGACILRPPPALQKDLVLWQDADDPTTLYLNDDGGVFAWRNKAGTDDYAFIFPVDSTQKLSTDGGRKRIVFSGGDYATRTFSLTSAGYSVYIVAKWQSDAAAGGNAPSQGILAGVDLDGELGHGLWYEARSDHEIRYRHRFPFGGGGGAVGDEVYGALYDANQGLQLIASQRGTIGSGYLRLFNGGNSAELGALTKTAFADKMRLHLGVNGPSGAGALEGEIAEILIYDTTHGSPNRAAVEDYLRVKWNIAKPAPAKL